MTARTFDLRVLLDESTDPDLLQITAIEGGRPAPEHRPPLMLASDLRLLGDFEGVIDLDAQISHGRFQLGVAEQQLHGSEFLVRR